MSESSQRERAAELTAAERAALGSRLLEKRLQTPIESIPRLSHDQSPLPLSFAQQRMWFMEQLTPGTALYNVPWAVRLTGPLDIAALRRSLDALAERYSILRTTYHTTAGVPYQVVSESTSIPFNMIDLRGASNTEAKLQQLLSEAARRPFDLTSDCMLRATFVQLADLEHVLLLVAHHISVDGWSCKILNQELTIIYESLLRVQEPALPNLPIQYADYAAWQRDDARNKELDHELEYWRTKLEGLSPTLDLPTSSSQPTDNAFSGGRVPIMIPDDTAARIRETASKLNITPFMVLASAVMITLYRYTGETDIAIGIPIAGRTRLETESLVGLFVNTLVLRGDLSGQPSFTEVVRRVKEVCLDAYDHQEMPFERIVADLAAERNEDRSPVVQVMLAYWNVPTEPLQLAGMESIAIKVGTDTSRFDLSFSIWETSEGLAGTLVYSLRLFNKDRMRDLAAHFVRFLEASVMEPKLAIGTLPMLSASERKRIVVDWNAATAPDPEERTLHGLFERAAAATPQATAVVCGDDSLTYADLNERANHVAYYLRKLGVQADDLVGISMHRSTDLVVGLLGILKAGAAYLPLDHRFPPDRLRYMMEDAAVSVLLTQSDLEANLPSDGIKVVRLDDDWPTIAQLEPVPSTETSPEDLAYVIYTSGSTGRPKGVMVSHRNVVGFLNAFQQVTDVGPKRISTNVITYVFDVSVEEIFSPLCYGGTLHIVPYETTLDGRTLANYILDHGITTVNTVPDLLPSIAETFEKHGGCGELACLITGLTSMKQGLLQRFRDISSPLRIINVYGPTETTCAATAYEFESATDPDRDVPIGRPFPDYQIYIVNGMLEPVPIVVTGEILIGGIGVSRGYLNQPDLTEERFIPNTFGPSAADRLYRTGDIGRYREDGTIEFLGRADTQVKIRGFRIELREIELAIEKHPLVKSCHASTSTLAEDDVRLVAYVVCTGEQRYDAPALRQHLLQNLPEYMIPSAFMFLDHFPLLPSGKIAAQALPQPEWSRGPSAERFVSPTTVTEKKLARIWEEVLKLDRVGITDNFFELGGHSLLAVRLINQIENLIEVRLSVAQFFENPTIGALASLIRARCHTEEKPYVLHVQTQGKRRPFFCMADVEYMFALAKALGAEQPFYGMRIPGLGQEEIPLDTIEATASYCVRAIERIDPKGPYLIGGHCFGGIVAFEVAQQLTRKGKVVDLLVMFDPDSLTERRRRKLVSFWMYRLWYDIKRRRVMEAIRNRLGSLARILASLWKRGQYLKLKRYDDARSRARAQYEVSPYSGRVLFIYSSERAAPPSAYKESMHQTNPWLNAARGDVRRLSIEGTHAGIFQEPGLRQLVEELRSEFGASELAQGAK